MKVLQICAAYKPAFIYGGPTMSVSMLSEQLARAGVTIDVFATTANGQTELPVVPGETVDVDGVSVTYFKRITKDHSHFSPALLRKLWKVVQEYDLVHIHAWWNLVSLFSCLIALMHKVPVLVSPRGTLSGYSFKNRNMNIKWAIHKLFGRPMLNHCHIHVTSQQEKESIAQLIRPKGIAVLPNFVMLPEQKVHGDISIDPCFKLLFFSRIEEKKGLDILLDALKMVTVPYHLTIAGDGYAVYVDTLKALAVNKKVDDRVSWIGFQNEDKFEVLRDHDLFILPSYDENFGNVVIECLAVGTAVLISEQVGLADYVKKNDLGWICQRDAVAVGVAINDIAKNQQIDLKRIRKKAPEIIYKDFNEDKLVKKYTSMYDNIING